LNKRGVETHLAACPLCAAALRELEASFSLLALSVAPRQPGPSLRERLLARVGSPAHRYDPLLDRFAHLMDLREEKARRLLARLAEPSFWRKTPWPAFALTEVDAGPGVRGKQAALARLQAGHAFPRHKHLGDERYLVLQGQCRECSGETAVAGDLVLREAGTVHAFSAPTSRDLIMAVVAEGIAVAEG